MNRFTIAMVVVVLFSGLAVAETHGDLDVGPGVVGADSPVYGVEVAMDNLAMDIGFSRAGGVTQERAAEAAAASEKNNTNAAARAAEEASNAAERANSDQDEAGVTTAMASLNNTKMAMQERAANAPNEQARQGMQRAVENMAVAMDTMEQAQQQRQMGADRAGSAAEDS